MKIKKRFLAFLFILIFTVISAIPLSAADHRPRLVDNARLLSDNEEKKLLNTLDEISTRQNVDIVVVTTDSLCGRSPMEYADDFYDENGYANDGILLLVSMEDRDWWVSTSGFGITAITDAGLDYISEEFLDDLSDGNYLKAFCIFAKQCDAFITQAKTGEPYDVGNLPKNPFDLVKYFVIALIIGVVVAFLVTQVMKSQLKSVRLQPAAQDYVKPDSMQMKDSRDWFLYRRVSRRVRPKEHSSSSHSSGGGSSTHVSSSGRTHGGGGGKF